MEDKLKKKRIFSKKFIKKLFLGLFVGLFISAFGIILSNYLKSEKKSNNSKSKENNNDSLTNQEKQRVQNNEIKPAVDKVSKVEQEPQPNTKPKKETAQENGDNNTLIINGTNTNLNINQGRDAKQQSINNKKDSLK